MRELAPQEVENVTRERLPAVKRFREIHHTIARLFVSGMSIDDIASTTGYSYQRIMTYQNDPAFQELLAQKRALFDGEMATQVQSFVSLATGNMLKAERQLAKRLEDAEDEGETLPDRTLVSIVSDRADRFGFGKNSTQFNVNADFAELLNQRLRKQREPKLVESTPASPMLQLAGGPVREPPVSQPVEAPSLGIRRRA